MMDRDPLAEATQIVRNAVDADATVNIDWTREPRTERERKIRARLIARAAAAYMPFSSLFALVDYRGGQYASDIARALKEAGDALERGRADRKRQEALDAAREVDE